MDQHEWRPRSLRPETLVRPVTRDRTGLTGPTHRQTRGARYRRTSPGLYVPTRVDSAVIEQRILEQAVRLPDPSFAVTGLTGWAALRWRGARYFEGVDRRTHLDLPVPLALGGWHDLGNGPEIAKSRERLSCTEVELVAGIPCAIAERALFDEIRRYRDKRRGVVALEMTVAARLLTFASFHDYVATCNGWTGVPYVRKVCALAGGDTLSPPEAEMRLAWTLDAGHPEPLCNKPVFALDGRQIGFPDLFDEVAGVVGEYGGTSHVDDDRRSMDRSREDRFRAVQLEYFEVVTGELTDRPTVVRRMRRARADARFIPEGQRQWTLTPPPGWTPPDWYRAA